MPVRRARQQTLRDLTTAAMVAQIDGFDAMVDRATAELEASAFGDTDQAEKGGLDPFDSVPDDDTDLLRLNAELFDSEDEAMEALQTATDLRYHEDRQKDKTVETFNVDDMLRMREKDYRHAMRTTPAGFQAVLSLIEDHPIFHSTSRNPPPSVDHQLAMTLERLGSNGNGASLIRIARYYKMSTSSIQTISN